MYLYNYMQQKLELDANGVFDVLLTLAIVDVTAANGCWYAIKPSGQQNGKYLHYIVDRWCVS